MVLVILAVVWAVYLVSWLRSRTETRNVNSISSFNRHLSVLERTGPGGSRGDFGSARAQVGLGPSSHNVVVRPRPALSPAKKRRKDILTGLMVATGTTALAAVVMGGVLRVAFVVSFVLLVSYVALLAQTQRRLQEQRTKVRYLAPSPDVAGDGWDDPRWHEVESDATYAAYAAGDGTLRYGPVAR